MGMKEKEIIRLRNEGMAYGLQIAKKHGIEELEHQCKLRGCLKVSVKFTPEELAQTLDDIAERVYNNMLCMVYAVLHDFNGFGKKRLTDFKAAFDKRVYDVALTDKLGRHWSRFEDFAMEANDIADWGIDIEKVQQTQEINDSKGHYIELEAAAEFLEQLDYTDAARELRKIAR